MNEFLEELTLEHLDGEVLELAETIGIEAFRQLVMVYGGSGRFYIPTLDKITAPVRNRHIFEDYKSGCLSVSRIALNYKLSEAYVRQIVKEYAKSEEQAIQPVSKQP